DRKLKEKFSKMITQNLVLVVTGASAGIGSGIVLVAIQNGARVIGCSRSSEKLETLKNEVIKRGYSVDSFNYVVGDASNKDVAKTTIEKAIELYGRIDAALNMLTACLAEEEKEIQTIAICPGPVFTESLEANYSKRAPYFKAFQEKYSIKEFRERSFHPEDTGHYVWGLITKFPTEFNGKFVLSTEPSLA
ncbi:6676_t:CDS:2, partial [Racocetra fulgida]